MQIGILSISLEGTVILQKERELLSHANVGGLVLFSENLSIESADPKIELKKLITEARKINPRLIVMVDHEGGNVWRLERGFTKLPAAESYGKVYDQEGPEKALEYAYEQAYIMASELLDCGVDLSLAPVVDLGGETNFIGKRGRAFHVDPEIVLKISEQFIKGMNDAGMLAVIKHFPGHGSCKIDSHLGFPEDNRSFEELQKDLYPFKKLIEKNLVAAVMSNHAVYPAVDKINTASFSSIWLKGCLRMGLGFNKVIMSDCLDMKGADIGTTFNRIKKAQESGNDFILITHQHGNKLENLLEVIDNIPYDKESAEKREIFEQSLRSQAKLALKNPKQPILSKYIQYRSMEQPLLKKVKINVNTQPDGASVKGRLGKRNLKHVNFL